MKHNAIIKSILSMAVSILVGFTAPAQELNCTVEVNSDQIEGSSKNAVTALQESIREYMNNTTFTNAQFAVNERIDCKLFFKLTEYTDNLAKGTLTIQSSRPVYNSTYTTTIINFQDSKIDFTYQENDPLVYNLQSMENQLTAILNFYAYLIIALDFDSFSLRGGEQYWDVVKTIVQQAQSAGEIGWKAFEDTKNRAAVLGAFTDPATQQLRDMVYQYHRNGLDEMSVSPDKGRSAITNSLETLQKVYTVSPMSVGLSMFRDAKLDELVNLYTKGTADERSRVVEILSSLYPTEQTRIKKIKDGTNK